MDLSDASTIDAISDAPVSALSDANPSTSSDSGFGADGGDVMADVPDAAEFPACNRLQHGPPGRLLNTCIQVGEPGEQLRARFVVLDGDAYLQNQAIDTLPENTGSYWAIFVPFIPVRTGTYVGRILVEIYTVDGALLDTYEVVVDPLTPLGGAVPGELVLEYLSSVQSANTPAQNATRRNVLETVEAAIAIVRAAQTATITLGALVSTTTSGYSTIVTLSPGDLSRLLKK